VRKRLAVFCFSVLLAVSASAFTPADDLFIGAVTARVGSASGDFRLMRTVTETLERRALDHPNTHVCRAKVEASSGEWSAADAALDRAATTLRPGRSSRIRKRSSTR
jgi:hypothetical protein